MATRALPELPSLVKKPLAWIPSPVKATAIEVALNTLFATPLQAGDLEFLAARAINILVRDAGLEFSVSLERNKLHVGDKVAEPDLSIEGTVYTFLQLASRKEDADTLFFRRKLKTSGDTELGLWVKNFLDGLEPEISPYHRILEPMFRSSLALADRLDKVRF